MKKNLTICVILIMSVLWSFKTNAQATGNNTYNANNYLGWSSNGDLPFKINGSQYMTLISGGSLGIGTTSPNALFNVYDVKNSTYSTTPTATLRLDNVNGSNSNNQYSSLSFNVVSNGGNTAAGYMTLIQPTAGSATANFSYILRDAGSGTFNEIMRMLSNGNVGIGTTSPNNLLQVAGLVNFDNTNYNTFLGYLAGNSNGTGATYGYKNSFLGYNAGYNNSKGVNNTFLGYQAAYNNTYANGNVAIGSNALYTQSYNPMAGSWSSQNVAVGVEALYNNQPTLNTNGYENTAIGYQAGYNNSNGSSNTLVGYEADVCSTCGAYSNSTALGYQAQVPSGLTGNYVSVGNSSITHTWVWTDWTIGSDRRIKNNIKENVPGLAFINQLKPVTFHYDIHKANSMEGYPTKTTITQNNISATSTDSLGNQVITNKPGNNTTVTTIDTSYWQGKYDKEKITYSGLIAQQVDSAAQKVGYDFSGVDKTGPVMGLRYAEFVVPLIKAVQELSKEVDSLKAAAKPAGSNQRTNSNSDEQGKAETTLQIQLANNVVLYQNEPNPFGESTVIRYYIPDNLSSNAYIVFYDFYGKELKKTVLTEKGKGQINADTKNLTGGIYSYSIVVDGIVKDTKKMIKE